MANSLTNAGQWMALGATSGGSVGGTKGSLATAGIVLAADRIGLFSSATTPAKDGTGFTQITGNGGDPKTIADSNWTGSLSGSAPNANAQVVLADQTWTASGAVNNIAGAYIFENAGGTALAWWERSSAIDLLSSDEIVADDLTIRLS
tara:strand:+ start:6881 stop:7324 length:444 start_codon:yes stop_codon:yes gene_type:complete